MQYSSRHEPAVHSIIIILAALKVSLTRNTTLHWGMAECKDEHVSWGFRGGKTATSSSSAVGGQRMEPQMQKLSLSLREKGLNIPKLSPERDGWRGRDGEKVIGVVAVL